MHTDTKEVSRSPVLTAHTVYLNCIGLSNVIYLVTVSKRFSHDMLRRAASSFKGMSVGESAYDTPLNEDEVGRKRHENPN